MPPNLPAPASSAKIHGNNAKNQKRLSRDFAHLVVTRSESTTSVNGLPRRYFHERAGGCQYLSDPLCYAQRQNMTTHLELFIKTAFPVTTDTLGQAIEPCLTNGWKFVPHDKAEAVALLFGEYLFYACDKTSERESAMVALYKQNDETFSVPNVVPNGKHHLPVDEYNVVLKDFHDTVLVSLSPDFTVLLIAKDPDASRIAS